MKATITPPKLNEALRFLRNYHAAQVTFLDDYIENGSNLPKPWYYHVNWEDEVKQLCRENPTGLQRHEVYKALAEKHACSFEEARTWSSTYLYYPDKHGIKKEARAGKFYFSI